MTWYDQTYARAGWQEFARALPNDMKFYWYHPRPPCSARAVARDFMRTYDMGQPLDRDMAVFRSPQP